jgi:hypothetical protein
MLTKHAHELTGGPKECQKVRDTAYTTTVPAPEPCALEDNQGSAAGTKHSGLYSFVPFLICDLSVTFFTRFVIAL